MRATCEAWAAQPQAFGKEPREEPVWRESLRDRALAGDPRQAGSREGGRHCASPAGGRHSKGSMPRRMEAPGKQGGDSVGRTRSRRETRGRQDAGQGQGARGTAGEEADGSRARTHPSCCRSACRLTARPPSPPHSASDPLLSSPAQRPRPRTARPVRHDRKQHSSPTAASAACQQPLVLRSKMTSQHARRFRRLT